ncbi:MAG: hypothetical protein WA755_11750 [Candidatus Acidiferrales bacterium]
MSVAVKTGAASRWSRALLVIFLFTLPLVNPWVRGDGVGYYAYARALLIEHRLDFQNDWRSANSSFVMERVDSAGNLVPTNFTPNGHIDNHFSVGPAILWSPFLIVTHATVLLIDRLGAHVRADGFSSPYIVAMAVATAFYGFLGLWISFLLARRFFSERWAFLATLGIWFASSLPVYMYFNPSWSHAHSAFAAALFLWYWERTRASRTLMQWAVLGLLAGLLLDVYYPNFIFLLAPGIESLLKYARGIKKPSAEAKLGTLLAGNLVFVVAAIVAFLPTLVTRAIIYGSPFVSGYVPVHAWMWMRPNLFAVLFSSDHGLLSWTPILLPAVLGLFVVRRRDAELGGILLCIVAAYYYFIASYPTWDGLSSFGNRFFISLTPIFIIGLAGAFEALEQFWPARRAQIAVYCATAVLIVWNLGFIFQWGTHLVPARGPISWPEMVHNQFAVVPVEFARKIEEYAIHRSELMHDIENSDVDQLRKQQSAHPQAHP